MQQPKLLEIDPERVEEFELAITGATGLEGGDDLQLDQVVTVELTGEVVGIRVEKRERKIKGTDVVEEFYVRKAVIKADGAKVSKLARRTG